MEALKRSAEETKRPGRQRPGPLLNPSADGHDAELFGISACAGRCPGGHRLLLVGASAQTQRADQNGQEHDRFQEFQSISPPFRAGCCSLLGRDLMRKQRFSHALETCARARQDVSKRHSRMTTDVPASTKSNNSATSALRIRMQPRLSGLPILSSCFVP